MEIDPAEYQDELDLYERGYWARLKGQQLIARSAALHKQAIQHWQIVRQWQALTRNSETFGDFFKSL